MVATTHNSRSADGIPRRTTISLGLAAIAGTAGDKPPPDHPYIYLNVGECGRLQ